LRPAFDLKDANRVGLRAQLVDVRVFEVERIEVGPKGAVLAFRDNIFANPEALIAYVREHDTARVRPDQKVVFLEDWEQPEERLAGTAAILRNLVGIAEQAKAA